jgi:hypothetical protein
MLEPLEPRRTFFLLRIRYLRFFFNTPPTRSPPADSCLGADGRRRTLLVLVLSPAKLGGGPCNPSTVSGLDGVGTVTVTLGL